jgi:hypothetical protein
MASRLAGWLDAQGEFMQPIATAPHQSESGHWYLLDTLGNAKTVYGVRRKSGKFGPATLRDAKRYGFSPGQTSVIRLLANPGLRKWQDRNLILAALTLPRNPGERDTEWVDRILDDAEEQASRAAEVGSEFHAAIQQAFVLEIPPEDNPAHRRAYVEIRRWISDHYSGLTPEAEVAFVDKEFGHAGKTDMVLLSSDSVRVILEHKTVESVAAWRAKRKPYDSWQMQIGGDALHFGGKLACVQVVIDRNTGECEFYEWTAEEVGHGIDLFLATWELWQVLKRYSPTEKWRELRDAPVVIPELQFEPNDDDAATVPQEEKTT